jgi:hypothetical protein
MRPVTAKKRLNALHEEVCIAYNNGHNLKEIALLYRSCMSTVSRVLKENGVVVRKAGRPKKEKINVNLK